MALKLANSNLPEDFDPLWHFAVMNYPDEMMAVPDIIEFVVSDKYLNRPNLYPRQATLLKIMTLQTELMTQYDYDVIGEWSENYIDTMDEKGEGYNGISPDILERIRICKQQGRPWFREVELVIGRRGSKGHIGGLMGSYVTWAYESLLDPQGYFGVDRDKNLACFVFAGKKMQARENQWADLTNIISGAPCFAKFISQSQTESLSLFTPHDFTRIIEQEGRGIFTTKDMATIRILPKESTRMSGRGPASYMQMYDEMAHMEATGATRSAEDVYGAATPALDTFQEYAFVFVPSSPWERLGEFYAIYNRALERHVDEKTGATRPTYPEVMMIQLEAWDIYRDWEKANQLEMTPGGLRFQELRAAIQEYDEQMENLERANPEKFAVERRSRFAAVLNVYLNPDRIREMFAPWPTEEDALVMRDRGVLNVSYRAHGDPSKSGANFGFAMGHVAGVDDRGLPHVVFDVINHWQPGDFPDHQIDYDYIGDNMVGYIDRFMPGELSFDQWNSVYIIQKLNKHVRKREYPKRIQVYERTATHPLNWKTYETFKTALGLGLVHAPFYDQLDLELTYLQDKGNKRVEPPDMGPVQTKDVADCTDPQTEVLTERGWVLIGDVKDGERVATRTSDGRLEYQIPTAHIKRWHTGELHVYESRTLNFALTPTHRVLVQDGNEVVPVLAKDLRGGRNRVPVVATVEDRPSGWIEFDTENLDPARVRVVGRGGSRCGREWTMDQDQYLERHYATMGMVDLCAVLYKTRGAIYNRAKKLGLKRGQIGDRVGDRPIPLPKTRIEDFAGFLGIWLAEGRKIHGHGYGVRITQTKPEGIAWIDDLFVRLGWPHRRSLCKNGEIEWVVKSRGLREYLRICQGDGHELRIPDEVFTTWTRAEMESLFRGLMAGDGCISGGRCRYDTTSHQLAQDVQRLVAHLGSVATISRRRWKGTRTNFGIAKHDGWAVWVHRRTHAGLDAARVRRVPYSGWVYCLTVPNGTLLSRRKGIPSWTGNCVAIVVYELIGNEVAAFIGDALADLPLGATQPGGMAPAMPGSSDEEVAKQFADFSRSSLRASQAAPPVRNRPRRR